MVGSMVSASTGAVNSLLGKLATLMGDEFAKLKGVRKEVASLEVEFKSMQAFLEQLAGMDELDPQAQEWKNQVKGMSYDIEDCIDNFMHHLGKNDVSTGFVKKTARLLKKLRARHQIASKIQEIKIRVKEVSERRQRYWLDDCNPKPSPVVADPRVLAIYKEAAGLVGIDGPREELVKLLMGEEKELKVASIVGFGGLGKTTLANQVYCQIKEQFECRAFVSVSQKPDIPKLLRKILLQTNGRASSHTNELDDINNLKEHLRNRRYFIVIDDLWELSAWEAISCAFPENNNCSRVLTTTRICSVAEDCCASSKKYVYHMKSLNGEHSRRLFFGRIFGTQEPCPTTLEGISADILKKCGGLPLAIISIASLLVGQPKTTWEYVRKSLGFLFEGNITLKGMEQILDLSYKHLPNHLKTCLLYLGIYPEDHIIDRDDLVWQWVSEGFARNMHGLDAEEVAGRYFNELINMSMIQPVQTDKNDEVLSCRVHDIMLDLIRLKCAEENFIDVIDYSGATIELHKQTHRVSLHCADARGGVIPTTMNGSLSQVRSVVVITRDFLPSFTGFKYVRVLVIETHSTQEMDIAGMCELFLLRYLKIVTRNSGRFKLPNQLWDLQYLETMILELLSSLYIPSDIVHLRRLLHLIVPGGAIFLGKIDSLKSLLSLQGFDVSRSSLDSIKFLGELTNLRYLELQRMRTGLDNVVIDVLHSSVERLFGSNSLKRFVMDNYARPFCFSGLHRFPRHIQMLNLSDVCLPRIPKGIGQLHDLHNLTLRVSELVSKDDDIGILAGLPSLVFLALKIKQVPEVKMVISGTDLAFIKYLHLVCPKPFLVLEAGAMPRLQELSLHLTAVAWEDAIKWLEPVGIEHLPASLKTFTPHCCNGCADEATKSAMRSVFNTHHPGVDLSFYMKGWPLLTLRRRQGVTAEVE
ncbi:hypothetical protein ACP70R_019931 [Stipagrostis hirtigluma subsp. patula]